MFYSLPFHIQLTLLIILVSLLLCFGLAAAGALYRKKCTLLPPVPLFPGSDFPGFFVQFYTAFFVITFSLASAYGCTQNPEASASDEENLINMIISAAMQVALYLPLLVVYFAQPSRALPSISAARRIKWIFLGLVALTLPAQIVEFAGLNQWVIDVTGCPAQQDVVTSLADGNIPTQILMVIMAVVIAPITEECCFRGCVYNILKQYTSPMAATLSSALLFSAVHASLAQLLPLFLFGVVQCYAYEKARSLWLPIVLHMLFNALSCTVILLYT